MTDSFISNKFLFLPDGGDMGELIRSYDWSNSLLGDPSDWPDSLKVIVGIMLASPFPMHVTWGPKFLQLYNDGYQPILGNVKHPKALGLPIYESYPEIWETVGPMFHGVMAGKAVRFTDFHLILDRNGQKEECYFDFSYSPIRNKQGVIEGVLTNVIETTKRKLVELEKQKLADELISINEEMSASNEELAAANEELTSTNEELARTNDQLKAARHKIDEGEVALRLALDAADFGTWFIHSVTREFITDARLKELFGYYPEEDLSIEQTLAQITDEYRGYVAAKLENAIYHNGDYDVTYPVLGLHDNRLRWLRAIGNLKADPSGTFSAFTGVVMEITDQVQAKISLENAYEQLRLSKEAAQLGFFDMDLTKDTLEWDVRCRELFGISHTDAVTYEKDFVTGLHPGDRDRILAIIKNVFIKSVSNGVYDVEYRTVGAEDQQLRWVRAKGQMYFNMDDKPVRFIGSVLDITEQKQDEIRKNDFIGMVSHELKTPLTSLNAYLQMLQGKAKKADDTFTSNVLVQSVKQVKRMTTMINGFLNTSRLESGKISIEKQLFDMAELVSESEAETIPMYSSHHIIFAPVEETEVIADRDKIGQVVNNFISNAVKYSKAGSAVNVACVTIDGSAVVSVRDEGIGIDKKEISKLFERYYRVEGNTHISGFGIGLYLSFEIIERHQGKIWAESEPGKGSTFFFSIPIQKQA